MTNKYRFLYFLRYMGDSFFFPYFSLFIASLGFEGTTLGIILAVFPFANIIANGVWSIFTTNVRRTRKIIQWITVVEAIIIFLFTQLTSIELIIMLTVLLGVMDGPYYGMQDGIAATYSNQNHVEYTSIRIFGSISWAIASFLAGLVIQFYGYHSSFMISALIFFLTVFVLHQIAPIEETEPKNTKKKEGSLLQLLSNPSFWKYLVFLVLCLNSAGMADAYFVLYLQSIGLAESNVGLVLGLTVIFEAFSMILLARHGNKLNEHQWTIVALVLLMIRFGVYALNLPLIPVLIVSAIKGIGWGILIYSNIKYIIRIVGVKQITVAILANSIAGSLFAVITHPILGYIYKNIGFTQLFLLTVVLMGIGLGFNWLFPPKFYKET